MQQIELTDQSVLSDVLVGGWIVAPSSLTIGDHEVHIWKMNLACGDGVNLDSLLSPDEQDRASHYHFERYRRRFRVARASLRMILSRYLDLAPASLTFGQTEYGKPFLTNPEAMGLLFNLSHSEDLALLAVTRDREVGIDVEFMRTDFATSEVAEHFFSVAEIYTFTGLEPELQPHAFFNCWTRKEAYIKARGEGLSLALDSFDVSLAPGLPATLLRNRFDPSEVTRWSLHALSPAPNYSAAIALENATASLNFRHFVLAE